MELNCKEVTFIHISDLHIGFKFKKASFSFEKGAFRRDELVATLYRVINYIDENGIDFLFITGDIFESKYIKKSDLMSINYKFGTISNCDIIMISGNHDPLSTKIYEKIGWNDNVHIIKDDFQTIVFEKKNCIVTGNAFQNEFKEPIELNNFKIKDGYHNFLLLHGNVFSNDDYCFIDKDKLCRLDYDYIALGHIHKHQFLQKNIAYAGSLEPLDFGETGEHGFILGRVGKLNSFKFVPFSKRKFIKVTIEVEPKDTIASLADKINESTKEFLDDFVKIIFTGYRNIHIKLDKQYFNNFLSFYYFEIVDNSKLNIDIKKIVEENENGFIAQFANSFTEQEKEDEIFKKAYELGITLLYEEQGEYES